MTKKTIFHSRPLFYGFLVLLLAISSARSIFLGKVDYIVIIGFILVVSTIYFLCVKKYAMLFLMFVIFAFGLGHFFVGVSAFEGNTYYEDCVIQGRITDQIETTDYGNVYLTLKEVKINGKKEKNIALKIKAENTDEINPGSIITFVARPVNQQLFSLGMLNFTAYREKTPYSCEINFEDVEIIGNKLTFDEKLRLKAKTILYENMGEVHGSTALAVLFGDRGELNEDVNNAYKSAGVVHLLTVSGLHVSFLIGLFGFILKLCRVRGIWNFFASLVFLGLYSYICGFSPSVVRAGIMGLLLLATKISGFCYDGLNSLGLAGIIILLYSPLFALDTGFLMSFFCVISIYVIAPGLTKIFKKFLPKSVAEGFAISIATQIGIYPFTANIFSTLNFLTMYINLLVIPFFGVLFPFLFLSLFVVMALPFMGFLLNICSWGFELIYRVADFFAQSKLIISLEPMNIILIILFFVFFFLISRFFMAGKKVKTICAMCIFSLFISGATILNLITPCNSVNFICNNYGDSSVMLTNSQGETAFVDTLGFATNRRLMDMNFVGDANILILLDDKFDTNADAQEIEIKNIYSYQPNLEVEMPVAQGETVKFGGFEFNYIFYNDQPIAVDISFDNTKVLIVAEGQNAKSQYQELAKNSYDFVCLPKYDYNGDFCKTSKHVLSYYANDYSTQSFQANGNICYKINGNNFERRILD